MVKVACSSAERCQTRLARQYGATAPVLGGLVKDLELYLVQFLGAADLARLGATSRGLRSLATLACAERLKVVMGMEDYEGDIEKVPMVHHFLQTKKSGLEWLLHVVTLCREQTEHTTLSLGGGHTAIITPTFGNRNAVFTFGEGDCGQLGHGNDEDAMLPRRVALDHIIPNSKVIDVACGAAHTCLLTEDGKVLTFGANDQGQLGNGSSTGKLEPAVIPQPKQRDGTLVRYLQVVAGHSYTAARTDTGRVAIFGNGLDVVVSPTTSFLPLGDVEEGERIIQLAAGQEHLLMLSDRNNIFAVGRGCHGRLGLVKSTPLDPEVYNSLTPSERNQVPFCDAKVPRLVKVFDKTQPIVHLAAGGNHSAYVTGDGDLYTWGACSNGELGLGKFCRNVPVPTKVKMPAASPYVVNVSCGWSHTAALTSCGRVVTFGNGVHKQDGKATRFFASHSPQEISRGDLAGHDKYLVMVVCGGRHSVCMDTEGTLFAFGDPSLCGRSRYSQAQDTSFLPRKVVLWPNTRLSQPRSFSI
mmetsp:Transcript_4346/g.7633  ORF Transcript_4346/g.7633 Transcript_4346/m.7633 type:complete len:527 (-) Transcript_4346:115-1695(-)